MLKKGEIFKGVGDFLDNTKMISRVRSAVGLQGSGQRRISDNLSLDNVVCVGGSWVAPAALIAAGDWAAIGKLAAAAAALAG